MEIIKGIQTQRGANLNIKGKADKILDSTITSSTYALNPDDFFGTVPKLLVKEGQSIKKGDPIFYSKNNPRIKIVSPIAGNLKLIQRGPKRKIEQILIETSENQESFIHDVKGWNELDREGIKTLLLNSGNWPFIHQRPYGIVAIPEETPKAIFVSTLNTAPLQVDFEFILEKNKENFQTGINALNKLVDQPVFLGVDKSSSNNFFEKIDNVQHYSISGPHPSGNLSLHIQKISPLNMGDRIWTVNCEDVANIGSFLSSGEFNPKRTLAIAGNAVKSPRYYKSMIGAELGPILNEAGITESPVRVINGDVLSGSLSSISGHVGYFNNLITVIPEGNIYRMFGWLPFKDNKILSLSNTSLSRLFNKKGHDVNTNLNGEERALVITGEMEKLFPFDVFPMQLIKACLIDDIEKMEALGIYEVVPEDFGLIDYSNTSKLEAQETIRQGIELMINEVG